MTWKAVVLRSRYLLRQLFRYTMGWAPFLLFILAFLMLAVAIMPQLRTRIQGCKVNGERLRSLRLVGHVYQQVRDDKGEVWLKPIAGAVVEAGGFRASTDATGRYELQFCSSTSDAIPIVVDDRGRGEFERVSFPTSSLAANKDFVLR